MGVVYRARDVNAGRDVALKLTLATERSATRRQRFLREGELTASLVHPGIIGVHSAGEEDGQLWIAYELVEGARCLEDASPSAPLEQRIEWIVQTATAVGYAHSKGVLHRDLKGENVLLDQDGRVRVADFGLATAQGLDRLTQTGALLGTPSFMSPEQLKGQSAALTPATDVWSLGVLLYQTLTGELPFSGGNLVELINAVVVGDMRRPRDLDNTVGPKLEAVCLRALQKDPTERYENGRALAEDLERALKGEALAIGTKEGNGIGALKGLALVCGVLLASIVIIFSARDRTPKPGGPLLPATDSSRTPSETDRALTDLKAAVVERQFRSALRLATSIAKGPPPPGAGVQEIYDALRVTGTDVAKRGPTRSLEQILEIAVTLGPFVDRGSETAFADSVFDRITELEEAAPTALGDPLVLSLVQQLTKTGLRPQRIKLMLLLERITAFERSASSAFPKRYYRLLLEQARMDHPTQVPHMTHLNWEVRRGQLDILTPFDVHEAYLRLALESDVKHATRRPAAAKLLLVLSANTSAGLGPVCRARAVYFASRGWAAGSNEHPEQVLEQACQLSPDDPELHMEAAEAYERRARLASESGEAVRADLERALKHTAAGVRALEQNEYDRVTSLAKQCFKLRRWTVTLATALGHDAQVQHVIDRVAQRHHESKAHQLAALEAARDGAVERWRSALARTSDKPSVEDPGGVDFALLRGYREQRLSGITGKARDDLVNAYVIAAEGKEWGPVEVHVQWALNLSKSAPVVHLELFRLSLAYGEYLVAEGASQLLGTQEPSLLPELRLLRGELSWARGELGEARVIFDQLAADDPRGVFGLTAAAEAAWLRGDMTAMIDAANAALAKDPDYATAHALAAMSALCTKRTSLAQKHFQHAFRRTGPLDPRLVAVNAVLTRIAGATADKRSARQEALQILSTHPGTFDRRLAIQLGLDSGGTLTQDWAQGAALRLKAPGGKPNPHRDLLLGMAKIRIRDPEATAKHWRKARARDPRLPIPEPYLKRYEAQTSAAAADAFR
jgi:tetratricopeptide (TPR) repeat protein